MESIQIIGLGVAVFIISIQYYALRKTGELLDAELVSHGNTLREWKRCLEEKKELIDKENYLLKAINDSMQVVHPKAFLGHRLSIAPYEPIEDERIKRDLIDEPK